jgi:antitoxin CptB
MSQPGSACDGLRHDHPEIRRRRLLFRCWHRGRQEIDLLLGSFAETSLAGLEGLLDCADADLFDWITGHSRPPPAYDHDVMRLLRSSLYRQKRG